MASSNIHKLLCPHCRSLIRLEAENRPGQAMECRDCGKAFRIPQFPGDTVDTEQQLPQESESAPTPISNPVSQAQSQPQISESPQEQASPFPTPPPIPLELLKPDAPLGEDLPLDAKSARTEELPPQRRRRAFEQQDEEPPGRRRRPRRGRRSNPGALTKPNWMQVGAGLWLVRAGWWSLVVGFWLWLGVFLRCIRTDRIAGDPPIPVARWMQEATLSTIILLPSFLMLVGFVLIAIGKIFCNWLPLRAAKRFSVAATLMWFLCFFVLCGICAVLLTPDRRLPNPVFFSRRLFVATFVVVVLGMISHVLFLSAVGRVCHHFQKPKIRRALRWSLLLTTVWVVLWLIYSFPGTYQQRMALVDGWTAKRLPSSVILMICVIGFASALNTLVFSWIVGKIRSLVHDEHRKAEPSEDMAADEALVL